MLRNKMGADTLSKKAIPALAVVARDPAGYTGDNRLNINTLCKCKHTVGRVRRLGRLLSGGENSPKNT